MVLSSLQRIPGVIGTYDWEKLDVNRDQLLAHQEWLEEIETTWLLQSEKVFNKAAANFSVLDNYKFREGDAASLFVAVKDIASSVSPQEVADELGVDKKEMWTYVKESPLRESAAPISQIYEKVQMVDAQLDEDVEDDLMDAIEEIPEHVRYSKRPSALVAAITYEQVESLTQKEAAELMDVTDVGLRGCKRSLDEARQVA